MDIDHLLINECAVALLRVLFSRITEETGEDGLLHKSRLLPARKHSKFMPLAKESGIIIVRKVRTDYSGIKW